MNPPGDLPVCRQPDDPGSEFLSHSLPDEAHAQWPKLLSVSTLKVEFNSDAVESEFLE